MHNHMLSQQDYFIYVPSVHDNKAYGSIEVENRNTHGKLSLPAKGDEWIKIPLAGQVIVYARMPESEEIQSVVA